MCGCVVKCLGEHGEIKAKWMEGFVAWMFLERLASPVGWECECSGHLRVHSKCLLVVDQLYFRFNSSTGFILCDRFHRLNKFHRLNMFARAVSTVILYALRTGRMVVESGSIKSKWKSFRAPPRFRDHSPSFMVSKTGSGSFIWTIWYHRWWWTMEMVLQRRLVTSS